MGSITDLLNKEMTRKEVIKTSMKALGIAVAALGVGTGAGLSFANGNIKKSKSKLFSDANAMFSLFEQIKSDETKNAGKYDSIDLIFEEEVILTTDGRPFSKKENYVITYKSKISPPSGTRAEAERVRVVDAETVKNRYFSQVFSFYNKSNVNAYVDSANKLHRVNGDKNTRVTLEKKGDAETQPFLTEGSFEQQSYHIDLMGKSNVYFQEQNFDANTNGLVITDPETYQVIGNFQGKLTTKKVDEKDVEQRESVMITSSVDPPLGRETIAKVSLERIDDKEIPEKLHTRTTDEKILKVCSSENTGCTEETAFYTLSLYGDGGVETITETSSVASTPDTRSSGEKQAAYHQKQENKENVDIMKEYLKTQWGLDEESIKIILENPEQEELRKSYQKELGVAQDGFFGPTTAAMAKAVLMDKQLIEKHPLWSDNLKDTTSEKNDEHIIDGKRYYKDKDGTWRRYRLLLWDPIVRDTQVLYKLYK